MTEFWFNVYEDGFGHAWPSRQYAIENATRNMRVLYRIRVICKVKINGIS